MDDAKLRIRLRRAGVLGVAAYGLASLRTPERFGVLDAVNLAIHETGHIVFSPFGEFAHFLGGTLFQLCFPLLFVVHFARRKDRFAAWILCGWVGQSLGNVSVYAADARAQLLPLVGGGEHDWAYLLGTLGWMEHDQRIAAVIHLAGVGVLLLAVIQAWYAAAEIAPDPEGERLRARFDLPPP